MKNVKNLNGTFKVGDLVQMSSYGLKTEQNEAMLIMNGQEIGIVEKIDCYYPHEKYPIRVQWMNKGVNTLPKRFFFRELKRLRT
jgi:hypothetical protein